MQVVEHEPLRMGLSAARAEQAEALRRANNLRARGAPLAEVREAMTEVDRLQTEVNRFQRQLRDAQTH